MLRTLGFCKRGKIGHATADVRTEEGLGGTLTLAHRLGVALVSGMTVVVGVSVSGCASRSGAIPLLDRLDGRGPVILSHENPFLPADRVFDNAAANSSVIQELVEQQGKPTALSVEKGLLRSTTLTFYYPGKEEFYTLKPAGDDWEVSGPDIMFPDEAQQMLSDLGVAVPMPAKPSAHEGVPSTLGRSRGSLSNLDTISARGRMHPEGVAARSSDDVTLRTKSAGKDDRRRTPEKATVKKLASGALQHTVTFQGETLASVSKWYTGSAKNSGAIAKLNKIKAEGRLTVGEKIVIPRQLVKTYAPLTIVNTGKMKNSR